MTDLPPIDSPETLPGWHMPWPGFTIDWRRAALVLVDLQNYGCNPKVGVAAMLAALLIFFYWVYDRSEPRFLTPVIDKLAPFFPSKSAQQQIEDKRRRGRDV